MSAGKYNIEIESGANFALEFTWSDDEGQGVDLEGYEAYIQVKDCVGGKVILEVSTITRDISLHAAGRILIEIPGEKTQGQSGNGVWDLLMVAPSGERTRLVEGKVTLERGVTEI